MCQLCCMVLILNKYLDETFLNAIDALFDTRTRDADAVWSNSYDIPVLSVELQIDIMRLSAPNYEQPI